MRSILLLLAGCAACAQTVTVQTSGTRASLRGVWAVSDQVCWASGTRGTYLRTTDGGATWTAATVPGAETLDFRDVQGVDANTAYLLSIGNGASSRVYKTTDAGAHWTLSLANPDTPKGFFDEMAFWNPRHGMLVGDSVDGRMVVMATEDGGATWQRVNMPPALPGEGAFAASGTGITVLGEREVWIGTGVNTARVYHSADAGATWTIAPAPLRADSDGAGIFSLAFADPLHGVAVGGDYSKTKETTGNIALTEDGGKTWTAPKGTPPAGFRSAVAYLADRKVWIAAGPSGADISTDGGRNWKTFDPGNYNALSFASGKAGFAVGPGGRIAKIAVE